MAKKFFTEKDMYNFIRRFSFPLSMENFRKALELTREEIKSSKEYHNGMFFKILLLELNRDINWEFAEEIEDRLIRRLE